MQLYFFRIILLSQDNKVHIAINTGSSVVLCLLSHFDNLIN